jgi:tripartite-type tricarboxylate transporter receptor subunit TctC
MKSGALSRRQSIAGLGALGASLLAPWGTVSAQAPAQLPADQMTLVVPFGSGSPPDLFARVFVEKLGRRLNRSVIVDLKPGASTTIGTAFAARSKPNGATLLYGTNSSLTAAPGLFRRLQYDPRKDFAAITVMLESYFCILVRPDDEATTVAQIARRTRENPAAHAMAGGSTTAEVSNKLFQNAAKSDHAYIRYNGNQMYTDLMGGRLNAVWAPMTTALAMVRQNQARIVAITGPRRLPQLPNVPTISETFPDVVVDSWSGFFVPAATPRPIVQLLHGHVMAVLADPEVMERQRADGNQLMKLTPEQSDEYVRNDFPKWERLLRVAGIEPQ